MLQILQRMRIVLFVLFILIIFSCKKSNTTSTNSAGIHLTDIDTSSLVFKYNNTLFTIPSPFQVTSIIRSNDIDYNKSFLSPPENVSNYTTVFKQSLNIGIYGTDMGYLNIYDQTPDII